MSSETSDTLGHQKKTNYALRPDMTKTEFINEVLKGLVAPPAYFPQNVLMNKGGYESIEQVLHRGLKPLSPEQLVQMADETGALLLDVRDPQKFVLGFIPQSINIGIRGSFAPWVGTLISDINQEIILVTEPGDEQETVIRLSRVGFDRVIGYLDGGFEAWKRSGREIDTINSISADALSKELNLRPKGKVLDVRKKSEYESESLVGAENLPLDFINSLMKNIDRDKTYYVHCGTGYRSVIFISILKARGYQNLVDITGGFKSMKESGRFTFTDYKCPTTML